MTYQSHPITSQAEIERLIHHMPAVARLAENDWAESFAQSIVKQSRRRGWTPSPKQLPVMRSLVSDLFAHTSDDGGDLQVIE